MDADVLRCDVRACTSATVDLLRTICCLMPPVLTSEALWWPWNIDANAACDAADGKVVVNSSVCSMFGLEANHQGATSRFFTSIHTVEPGTVSNVKVEGTNVIVGLFYVANGICHTGLLCPDGCWHIVGNHSKGALQLFA